MSNAFDKASLVMLPHAYEEGKVYSLKPTDRSGDFTFSRGTDTATRVNEQGYIEILTDLNSPRLDYLNSSCPSLLLEPQRTNIAKNDLGFNGFAGCTIANEVVTNPFGDTTDVFSATFTSTGGFRLNDSPSLISGTEYCMGHFMKFNNSAITISASGASGAILSASGAFSFDSSGNPSKIGDVYFIEYPNGWYYVYALTNAIANGGTRVNWNESSGSILICKSQYEAGSYPTSYIPTYGSSQTRAADDISTVFSTPISTDGNVSYFIHLNGSNFERNMTGKGASFDFASNNYITYNVNNAGFHRIRVNAGGSNIYTTSVLKSEEAKILTTINGTNVKVFVNGVENYDETLPVVPDFTSVLSFVTGGSDLLGELPIKQILLFPTALSDDECIALTTL